MRVTGLRCNLLREIDCGDPQKDLDEVLGNGVSEILFKQVVRQDEIQSSLLLQFFTQPCCDPELISKVS